MTTTLEKLAKIIEENRRNYSGDPFWEQVATYYIEQSKELRETVLPIIAKHENIQFKIIAKNCKEREALADNQMLWNKLSDKVKEILGEQ